MQLTINAFGMPDIGEWMNFRPAADARARPAAEPARPVQVTRPVLAISLHDRLTGEPVRVGGAPLVVLSRDLRAAAEELLHNRDPRFWEVRSAPLPHSPGPNVSGL